MKKISLVAFLLAIHQFSFSQTIGNSSKAADQQMIRICTDDLKWTEMKTPMAPGAKMAVVEGNPKETGHFTIRVWLPKHYKIPPHVHPVDERTTVLYGKVSIGLGDQMDTLNTKEYSAGCFYLNPAGLHHYVYTTESETILQISTMGPWGINFLDSSGSHTGDKK